MKILSTILAAKNCCLLFGATMVFSAQLQAFGVPLSDYGTTKVTSLYNVDYKADQQAMFQHKSSGCRFLAITSNKSDVYYLNIKKMVCNDLSKSLENRTIKLHQNIRAGDEISIPVGLVDFINLNIESYKE